MKKKDTHILIVGGAGYIGSHANKLLTSQGYQTIVLDNLSNGRRDLVKWGHFVEGDLNDSYSLEHIFTNWNISTVMHFGAFAYVGESVKDPAAYYNNNVVNTLHLLNAMRKHGVNQIVFSSTCATFGEPEYIPVDESHVQSPMSPYGRSKWMVEQILKDYEAAYGIRHVILRYFNAAGADPECETGEWHQPETHLIPLVLDAALYETKCLQVFGNQHNTFDGTCVRDYIHVCDLADAHLKAMQYMETHQDSDHFNLGNGKGFSVLEIIETARRITGRDIHFEIREARAGDPAIVVGSSEKALALLKWSPKFNTIQSIIETAWNWHISRDRRHLLAA